MDNVFLVLVIIAAIAIWYFIKKKPDKRKRNISIGLLLIFFAGFGVSTDSKEQNSSETSASSSTESTTILSSTTTDSSETKVVDLSSSLSSFETFTDSYESLQKEQRTPAWENIEKSEVTWTGKVIDHTGHTLVLVRSDKWEKGMNWDNVQKNPKDPYYVFIADFDNDIDASAYPAETEVTIKGSLESRGDPDMPTYWKLYHCEITS